MPQTDLLEALIDKLATFSPVWSETFAGSAEVDVAGFKRTQLMIREYGESTVRRAFEMALDGQIVPKGRSALGLMHSLCRRVAAPSTDEIITLAAVNVAEEVSDVHDPS